MKNNLINSKIIILTIISFFFLSNQAIAQCESHSEEGESCCVQTCCASKAPDGVAPVGVMSDHIHHKKGLMFSYRLMHMNMSGNLSGTNEIANPDVFSNYMMAPDEMFMQMHMFGAMYGLSDRVTLMAMMNVNRNEMSMNMMNGTEHTHNSSGIGDLKLSSILSVWKNNRHSFNANLGISIPTGNIGITEMVHMMHNGHEHMVESVMPYPMRLGSGTFDAMVGVTYLAKWNKISFGAQTSNTIRTGENDRGYRLGNNYAINTWGAYRVNSWMSVSLRGEGVKVGSIEGKDDELMAMMSPPNNAANSGQDLIRAHAGVNLYFADFWKGLHIGTEFGVPVYQNVEGVQMKQQNVFTVGVRFDVL